DDIPEQLLQAHGLTCKDWRKAQTDDPTLNLIISHLQQGSRVPAKRTLDKAFDTRYLKEWDRMYLSNAILHRKVILNGQDFQQLVLPPVFREDVFQALHNDLGHQGRDRTTSLVKQRFFWPGMDTYIKEKVKACDRCTRRKTGSGKSAELVNISSTSPMELVCLDYLSLERSKGGFENVLVITDHFSRYSQAIPTRNQTAKTTARVLFDNYIVHYGFPARIHSDQAQNFESKLIKELCQIAKVEKSRTTPYHPMGNGQVERFNQTLLQMLGTLEEYQKSDWKAHIPTLVHAYNATFHDSTGYSPYFLMFGRHPRLAIDAFLGLTPDMLSAPAHTEYVKKLTDRLHFAYQKAQEESKKSAALHKKRYDMTARSSVLKPGDRVLVKNVSIRGKCKLADRWEQDPYIIQDQPNPDIPVYKCQRENSRSKKTRTLHRNLLLPITGLPCLQGEEDPPAADIDSALQQGGQSISESENDADSERSERSLSSESKTHTTLNGSVSDGSRSTDKYVIPNRRKPGEAGLLPRTTGLSLDGTLPLTRKINSSSDEESIRLRPKRSRRKPSWMNTDDWIVGQMYTFVVEPDQVVYL
ncbi:MAG: DDE-type integrase/transposase/recombinase, partial [Candidatus Thiodiazotropha sp.]|nr:DDE-type integrase/transposase/recombinase [Candidatus Thiodiazotropha sp.]